MRRRVLYAVLGVLAVLGVFVIPDVALAQDEISPADLKLILDNVWILIAAFLVFLMQAGFAMVEAGFTRQKNAANIMMKNLMDFSMATIAYWAVGFALMFGAGNALVGTAGWFLGDPSALGYDTQGTMSAGWLFQVVFAGTAATIISGAMAERTKFKAYLIYSGLVSGIIYPISGHWVWGGGWLADRGFMDFAGSTVVHSVGAWAALVGAILVGPRLGKYSKDGRPRPIFGHSMPLGILGVFILWFGWFGFNPGSQLAADIRGVAGAAVGIAHIAVTTNIAAAFGAVTGMFTIWVVGRKPDVGMAGNGALAGLVGITAGTAFVEPWAAALIGMACGFVVVIAVMFFDRVRVDDPVGAISVHGVCGALGTLAVGLFAAPHLTGGVSGLFYGGGLGQLATQALGVLAVFGWVIVTSFIVFAGIKYTVGLRVDEEEELEGLDIGEHGMWGYPEAFLGPSGQASPEALAQARQGLRDQAPVRRPRAASRS